MLWVDVQGESHKFKKFLSLTDYQLDDISYTGKVSSSTIFVSEL